MSVLSVTNVKKEFNDIVILENVSFDVYPGQRVGIIGRNGSGKTTLLKLISGRYECDDGSIFIPSNVKMGVLDQIPRYPDNMTVEDVLRTSFYETEKLKRRMIELEKKMATGDQRAIREYGETSSAFEALGGYTVDVELNRVCNGLKIGQDMLSNHFNMLSGGERTRINLARMILMQVDLMLLDEPTNHLDFQSVEWLEEYLKTYKGTVLIVSHDRYFIDQTVTRIVELENLTAKVYEGNYSAFVKQKEHMIRSAEAKIRQDERKIAQLEQTARRLHSLDTEKMHKRAFAMEKRIERIKGQMPVVVRENRNLKGKFGQTTRSGEDVLSVKRLKKSFGDRLLFSDVDLEIKKDDRIVILGPNGSGKTTLVRILLGQETPDEGMIRWGASVKIAYLPQIVEFKNEYMSVLDCVVDELNISISSARNWLGGYYFRGEEVFKLVRDLSGGEKSRLKLCILMYKGANMLILDEPTNHLDLHSSEWIEEAISDYKGTLLVISHDRFFINRVGKKIWSIEDGTVNAFNGNYEEFKIYMSQRQASAPAASKIQAKTTISSDQDKDRVRDKSTRRNKRSKETIAARKQIRILESDIEKLENDLENINVEFEHAATDHLRLAELMKEKAVLDEKLEHMLEEWEKLMNQLNSFED